MDNQRKKISGASLRHAFEEIIWPRRKLIFVGLLLIVLNRVSGLVLPASTTRCSQPGSASPGYNLIRFNDAALGRGSASDCQPALPGPEACSPTSGTNLRQYEVWRTGLTNHG